MNSIFSAAIIERLRFYLDDFLVVALIEVHEALVLFSNSCQVILLVTFNFRNLRCFLLVDFLVKLGLDYVVVFDADKEVEINELQHGPLHLIELLGIVHDFLVRRIGIVFRDNHSLTILDELPNVRVNNYILSFQIEFGCKYQTCNDNTIIRIGAN